MKIRRTPRGYVEDDLDFASTDTSAGSIEAVVSDKPRFSSVLGSDGFPLEYTDEPVGFDLTGRQE